MRRHSQKTALVTLSDINITPLLDLAFVLLIIFMITTPLMEQGLRLELPKSQVTDASPEKNDLKMVEVDPSGNYFLETQPVSLSTLQEALAAAFEQNQTWFWSFEEILEPLGAISMLFWTGPRNWACRIFTFDTK